MADYFGLTGSPLPALIHGADGDYAIRTLSDRERLAIEDWFSRKDIKVSLDSGATAVVVPQGQAQGCTMEDFAVLVEFALGVLSVSGFQPVTTVATVSASGCSDALRRSYPEMVTSATFPKKLAKTAASAWMRHFFAARRKISDNLHITADRFVRYSRMAESRDAMVDLCICLESLIESQTEISFRFAMCLAKVSGVKDLHGASDLLSDLYDLRSKVVHGTDFRKEHKKVCQNAVKLRLVARAILITYILYLTEHTKAEWKKHLKASLLA
jgi:hypothetical protein